MLEALADRLRRGDRLALARLLSLVARGEGVEKILAGLPPPARPSRIVAFTGSGGVGKSTLVGKLIEFLRRQQVRVAVLACDPQSPRSGGALLGDRFRMPSRPDDDGVFIRSLAARSGHGAVAERLDAMAALLEAFGFDVILIETVGAGQGDTAVRNLADAVVLLLQPETGDDLQWEKAGVLEVADIVVIHKADLPGAEQLEAQVRATLGLSSGPPVPVLRVSARTGEGLEPLWDAISRCPGRRREPFDGGHELLRLAQQALAERFARAEADHDQALVKLLADWREGKVTQPDAVENLLKLAVSLLPSPLYSGERGRG